MLPPQSTRSLLCGIWGHLSRRIQLGLLLVVMLASGGAELSAPEQLWQQPLIQSLAARAGFTEPSQLLLPATMTFAAAAAQQA